MALATNTFRVAELTAAINNVPPMPMQVRDLGIFPAPRGIATRTGLFERQNGSYRLVEEAQDGGPADHIGQDTRDALTLRLPLYKADRPLHAVDVLDRRAFGTDGQPMQAAEEEARIIQSLRWHMDVTLEAHMASALQGRVLKSDGTNFVDMFTEMGETQKTVAFDFGATGQTQNKAREVVNHIDANINGDTFNGVTALVSTGFMDALLAHDSVQKFYTGFQDARLFREQAVRQIFHAGILFIEYTRSVTQSNGVSRALITANEGIAFPTGTLSTFDFVVGPSDYTDLAGDRGLPLYASEYMQNNSASSPKVFEAQARPLAICMRPQVLVKLTIAP